MPAPRPRRSRTPRRSGRRPPSRHGRGAPARCRRLDRGTRRRSRNAPRARPGPDPSRRARPAAAPSRGLERQLDTLVGYELGHAEEVGSVRLRVGVGGLREAFELDRRVDHRGLTPVDGRDPFTGGLGVGDQQVDPAPPPRCRCARSRSASAPAAAATAPGDLGQGAGPLVVGVAERRMAVADMRHPGIGTDPDREGAARGHEEVMTAGPQARRPQPGTAAAGPGSRAALRRAAARAR